MKNEMPMDFVEAVELVRRLKPEIFENADLAFHADGKTATLDFGGKLPDQIMFGGLCYFGHDHNRALEFLRSIGIDPLKHKKGKGQISVRFGPDVLVRDQRIILRALELVQTNRAMLVNKRCQKGKRSDFWDEYLVEPVLSALSTQGVKNPRMKVFLEALKALPIPVEVVETRHGKLLRWDLNRIPPGVKMPDSKLELTTKKLSDRISSRKTPV